MNAQSRYFELWDDMAIPGRWVLKQTDFDDQGRRVDPWQFKKGKSIAVQGKPILGVAHPGQPLDFSLTELATPVITQRVASLFERLGLQHEVQFIPARVEDSTEPYFILNVLRIIRCIDEARCEEVRHWEPRHGDPNRVGEYRDVVGMKVDPTKIGATHILRPWGWKGAIIVTERLKLAMESENITGTKFVEV